MYPARIEERLVFAQKWTFELQGNVLSVKGTDKKRIGGGKRMKITEFSQRSRRAMLNLLNRLVFDDCCFITLTYQDNQEDAITAKRHLYAFRKALERRVGKRTVVWRIERQKRGACHFHLLMLGEYDDDTGRLADDLAKTWDRITGGGDEKGSHVRFGCRVDKVGKFTYSDRGAVVSYIAKYTAKDDNAEGLGRAWGCWRKDQSLAKQLTLELCGTLAQEAIEKVQRAGGVLYSNPSGGGAVLYLADMGKQTQDNKYYQEIMDVFEKYLA